MANNSGVILFLILGIPFIWFIGYLYVGMLKALFKQKPSFNSVNMNAYKKAKPKAIKHKSYDYWDDAGDGSGVNYVQMPDGSVRID